MAALYTWILYLHILSIASFFAAHGISIGSAFLFRLRRVSNQGEYKTILDLSRRAVDFSDGALLSILVTGVALGFLGNWWGQLWIWVSLLTLIIGGSLMSVLGTGYYDRARGSLGLKLRYPKRRKTPGDPKMTGSPDQLETSLSSRSIILMSLGGGGLIFILWLMIFKPF